MNQMTRIFGSYIFFLEWRFDDFAIYSVEKFGKSKDKKVCEKNCPEACKQVEYEVSLSYGGLQREALIEHLMEFLNESDSSSVGRDIYAPLLNMTNHEREEFIK